MKEHNTDLNFNKLAWNSPNHCGKFGYLPGDEYYYDIIDWLKTGEVGYKTFGKDASGDDITITGLVFEQEKYRVIVTYYWKNEMISYTLESKY